MFGGARLTGLLKYKIYILVFLVAGTVQSSPDETKNEIQLNFDAAPKPTSINMPLEDLRSKMNNITFVDTTSPVNSSVILETNSTQTQNEEDATRNLELLHILKQRLTFYFAEKQSFISSLLIIMVATISVFLYFTLVLWRRRLQRIYGNRECLVQNEILNEKNPPDYV